MNGRSAVSPLSAAVSAVLERSCATPIGSSNANCSADLSTQNLPGPRNDASYACAVANLKGRCGIGCFMHYLHGHNAAVAMLVPAPASVFIGGVFRTFVAIRRRFCGRCVIRASVCPTSWNRCWFRPGSGAGPAASVQQAGPLRASLPEEAGEELVNRRTIDVGIVQGCQVCHAQPLRESGYVRLRNLEALLDWDGQFSGRALSAHGYIAIGCRDQHPQFRDTLNPAE